MSILSAYFHLQLQLHLHVMDYLGTNSRKLKNFLGKFLNPMDYLGTNVIFVLLLYTDIVKISILSYQFEKNTEKFHNEYNFCPIICNSIDAKYQIVSKLLKKVTK